MFEQVESHEFRAEVQAAMSFATELLQLQRKAVRPLGMPKAYDG